MKIAQLVLLVMGYLTLAGCQSGKELHYFTDNGNYYRLKVREAAFLSSSRYVSGYYDDRAVDSFFDEIKRTDTTASIKSHMQAVAPNGEVSQVNNAKLVMILSTNSDMVANSIGNIATNEMAFELLARMANKDVISQNDELTLQLDEISRRRTVIKDAGQGYLVNIDPDSAAVNAEQTKSDILGFLNQLASGMGARQTFSNLKEAELWFSGKILN